jgi:hypothetical protein
LFGLSKKKRDLQFAIDRTLAKSEFSKFGCPVVTKEEKIQFIQHDHPSTEWE